MTVINNFLLNLAARKCSKKASENIELKNHLMQCIKMLNPLILKLIKHLPAKSKGLWWRTGYLIFFYLLLIRDQLSLIGRGEDFRGSHDFQGEKRGNQSSPTEFKGGDCRN